MKDDRLVEMRVFKAVADAGGFTAAAHILGASQPFVSQSVTSLERRLGVQLLHRSTRVQRLTVEGERFLAACSRILQEIDHAETEIGSARAVGDLRISAPLAFGMDQVVPSLPAFLTAHPQIRLHLSLSDALANLIEDGVDVAVRMGRLQDSSLISRKLCNLQRIVVASPAYVAAHGMPRAPGDLAGHNCLLWSGSQEHLNRWPFLIHGEREEITARGNFRSSNGMTLFQLCIAGVGVMRLAEHLALPAIRRNELVPLLPEYLARDDTAIHAVYLPERQLVPRIRAFVDHLIDIFKAPPWDA
jgi:DNA-binding transcriptional LysR family regulator